LLSSTDAASEREALRAVLIIETSMRRARRRRQAEQPELITTTFGGALVARDQTINFDRKGS
jgi:hypothetical protein